MNLTEYRGKLEAGEIPVETNGHRSYYYGPHEIGMRLMVACLSPDTDYAKINPMESPLDFPIVIQGSILNRCPTCGKEPSYTIHEDRLEYHNRATWRITRWSGRHNDMLQFLCVDAVTVTETIDGIVVNKTRCRRR